MQPALETSGGLRIAEVLTSSKESTTFGKTRAAGQRTERDPEWTEGLKRLYNSVVEEPLPGNFADLLAKLDQDS